MNKIVLKTRNFFSKNSSTVLTCLGAAGVIGTTIMAVKATPKALILLEDSEKKKGEKLTVLETVKVAGPVYIPAAAMGVTTIACIFGANSLNKKVQASLASAYALADQTYKQYRNKTVELYGESADVRIREAIMKDTIVKKENLNSIMSPWTSKKDDLDEFDDKGKVLFYDEYSNRYFEATAYEVRDAEYHLNRNFSLSGYCALNDYYDFLGIDRTEYGDTVGWNMEDGFICIDIHHRKVILEDGLEVCVIEYIFPPDENYENPDCNYCNE